MSINALVAPLMRVRLFQGLDAQQLATLARAAERIMFREGQTIVAAGNVGDAAIIIVNGPAESFGSQPDDREFVAPGSVIGEMAMFIEHVYGTSVIARGPVKALRFTRDAMHQLMLDDQTLAEFLVSKISSRLTMVAEELRRIDDTVVQQQQSLSAAFQTLPTPVMQPEYGQRSIAMH
jgi:CRP-like cAMP-binding protein